MITFPSQFATLYSVGISISARVAGAFTQCVVVCCGIRNCQRAVNVGGTEGFEEVFHARATGGNQLDVANFTHFFRVVLDRKPLRAPSWSHIGPGFSGTTFCFLLQSSISHSDAGGFHHRYQLFT